MPPVWKDGAPLWVDGAPAFATDPCDCCGEPGPCDHPCGCCYNISTGANDLPLLGNYLSWSGIPSTMTRIEDSSDSSTGGVFPPPPPTETDNEPVCSLGLRVLCPGNTNPPVDRAEVKKITVTWTNLNIINGTYNFDRNVSTCTTDDSYYVGDVVGKIEYEYWASSQIPPFQPANEYEEITFSVTVHFKSLCFEETGRSSNPCTLGASPGSLDFPTPSIFLAQYQTGNPPNPCSSTGNLSCSPNTSVSNPLWDRTRTYDDDPGPSCVLNTVSSSFPTITFNQGPIFV